MLDLGHLRVRVDSNDGGGPLGTARDISEAAVSFPPYEVRSVGDELCRRRADAAATIRLESFRIHLEPIGRAGEALEVEIEGGLPLVVGSSGGEVFLEALACYLWIVELVAGVLLERWNGRRE